MQQRLIVTALVFAALLSVARSAEEKFTTVVSPQDFTAAGLNKLTPDQLARLDALIENYKTGALVAARKAADEALAAKEAAEAAAARSEAKAQAAEAAATKAEAQAAKPSPKGGLLTQAKQLFKSDAKSDAIIETTIPGKFRGWGPRQIFVLANGQRLQVANNESYYSPVVENPRVQVLPAAITGYWLRFPDLGTQVRVRLVSE